VAAGDLPTLHRDSRMRFERAIIEAHATGLTHAARTTPAPPANLRWWEKQRNSPARHSSSMRMVRVACVRVAGARVLAAWPDRPALSRRLRAALWWEKNRPVTTVDRGLEV
jgi:hypothetical protein